MVLVDDFYGRVWYKLDRVYNVPEIDMIVSFGNPSPFEKVRDYSVSMLYNFLLE